MPVPVNEDTRGLQKYFPMSDLQEHLPYYNASAVNTIKAGDPVIAGPYFGIADTDILPLTWGTINCEDGELVNTAEIAPGSTFVIVHGEVWLDRATGLVQDASANNLYGIGTVLRPVDADGAMYFVKRRLWVREAFYAET